MTSRPAQLQTIEFIDSDNSITIGTYSIKRWTSCDGINVYCIFLSYIHEGGNYRPIRFLENYGTYDELLNLLHRNALSLYNNDEVQKGDFGIRRQRREKYNDQVEKNLQRYREGGLNAETIFNDRELKKSIIDPSEILGVKFWFREDAVSTESFMFNEDNSFFRSYKLFPYSKPDTTYGTWSYDDNNDRYVVTFDPRAAGGGNATIIIPVVAYSFFDRGVYGYKVETTEITARSPGRWVNAVAYKEYIKTQPGDIDVSGKWDIEISFKITDNIRFLVRLKQRGTVITGKVIDKFKGDKRRRCTSGDVSGTIENGIINISIDQRGCAYGDFYWEFRGSIINDDVFWSEVELIGPDDDSEKQYYDRRLEGFSSGERF